MRTVLASAHDAAPPASEGSRSVRADEWIGRCVRDARQTIVEYGKLCKAEGKAAKKILLTFTPCSRPKTMKFLHWLGVSVPEATEKAILEAESPVATSVNLLCDMFKEILLQTAKSGVPLGVSIEHVSIFREVRQSESIRLPPVYGQGTQRRRSHAARSGLGAPRRLRGRGRRSLWFRRR